MGSETGRGFQWGRHPKVSFGHEDGANQLSLENFHILSDEEANILIRRAKIYEQKAYLRRLRKERTVLSISEALLQPLPFIIPIFYEELVAASRGVFCLGGLWPGVIDLAGWIEASSFHGDSDMSAVCRDDRWIGLIRLALQGVNVYRDQKGSDSSDVRIRPDSLLYYKDTLFLKATAMYSDSDHHIASEELTSQFSSDAFQLFPLGNDAIIGVTSSANRIRLYSLSHNEHTYKWVVTISGPASTDIHLVPGVRLGTTNGHHVRWVRDGLLNEFNCRKDLSVMLHIKHVYEQKLLHVEWGVVIGENKLVITRVEHIRLALEELHAIGLAHCDVFVKNVYYDKVTCCAFLADLEYLTPVNNAPSNTKTFGFKPSTAFLLTLYLFDNTVNEVVFSQKWTCFKRESSVPQPVKCSKVVSSSSESVVASTEPQVIFFCGFLPGNIFHLWSVLNLLLDGLLFSIAFMASSKFLSINLQIIFLDDKLKAQFG
eukprot:gene8162-16779_t